MDNSTSIENRSPYCKSCESCGDTGCCKPTICSRDENCEYLQTNLNELKFGWSMNEYFQSEIYPHLPEEIKAKYDGRWDTEYDKWNK